MAAAGSLGAAGCLWPPTTTILLTSSPSSSDSSRLSATTDAPSLSLSAVFNESALGPVASGSPRSSAFPPAPASSTAAAPSLGASCPPLALQSPVPAVAAPFCHCPLALRPSCSTTSGLSGDDGDNITVDDAEYVGEAGSRSGAACICST